MSDGGKGSVQRPMLNRKTFEESWNEIFNNGNHLNGPSVSSGGTVGSSGGDQGRNKSSLEDRPEQPRT